jgi:hypothetical protein
MTTSNTRVKVNQRVDLPRPQGYYDLTVNVLGLRTGDEWSAVALEMDLWGHGATFEEAVEDLRDLVRMQISFAHSKGQPEMIWRPAEPVWFQRFADVRRERLEAFVREQVPPASDYAIAGLPLPPAEAIDTASFEALSPEP